MAATRRWVSEFDGSLTQGAYLCMPTNTVDAVEPDDEIFVPLPLGSYGTESQEAAELRAELFQELSSQVLERLQHIQVAAHERVVNAVTHFVGAQQQRRAARAADSVSVSTAAATAHSQPQTSSASSASAASAASAAASFASSSFSTSLPSTSFAPSSTLSVVDAHARKALHLEGRPSGWWSRPTTLSALLELIDANPRARLVAGNTARGVYGDCLHPAAAESAAAPLADPHPPAHCIDLLGVAELATVRREDKDRMLSVGSTCTLTALERALVVALGQQQCQTHTVESSEVVPGGSSGSGTNDTSVSRTSATSDSVAGGESDTSESSTSGSAWGGRTVSGSPPVSCPAARSRLDALLTCVRSVGSVQVRNAGTLGGNLLIAGQRGFPSDLATALLGLDASLSWLQSGSSGRCHLSTLEEFLSGAFDLAASETASGLLVGISVPLQAFSAASWSIRDSSLSSASSSIGDPSSSSSIGDPSFSSSIGDPSSSSSIGDPSSSSSIGDPSSSSSIGDPSRSSTASTWHTRFERVALRRDAAYAHVNALFSVGVSKQEGTFHSVRLAFGGLGRSAFRACATERFLEGCSHGDTNRMAEAVRTLETEISTHLDVIEYRLVHDESSHGRNRERAHRNSTARNLFYRFLLSVLGEKASPALRSAATALQRGVSCGTQRFFFDESKHWPVSQPLPKRSAAAQLRGDAQFTDDIPLKEGTVHAALVTSTVACGRLLNVDTSAALLQDGVLAAYTAADIPAKNSLTPRPDAKHPMLILAHTHVSSYGQPVAIVLAATPQLAWRAARLVRVCYADRVAADAPCLSLQSAVQDPARHVPECDYEIGDAAATQQALSQQDGRCVLRGSVLIGSQNHFYMEPLSAYAVPDEEGTIVVYTGMQWPGATHSAVAATLGLHESKVRVIHRRAGGGFGGKATNASWVACLAAVAAYRSRRPVRLTLSREDDLKLVGGREEISYRYEAAHSADGRFTALRVDAALNSGWTVDQTPATQVASIEAFSQVYRLPVCHLKSAIYLTNVANRSPMRGPGELSSSFAIETIICEIAHRLQLPPHVVRERNMYPALSPGDLPPNLPNGKPLAHYSLPVMWERLKTEFGFDARRHAAQLFNRQHRWQKRGVDITPVRFEVNVWAKSATVNVYGDGSVVVHSGVTELGQGAHVKIAQVVANTLNRVFGPDSTAVDPSVVRNVDLDTTVLPNQMFTGNSTGSEGACAAASLACEQLVKRLAPCVKAIQAKKREDETEPNFLQVSWAELCAYAKATSVDLSAHAHWSGARDQVLVYQNYGCCASEIALDCLTGEIEILHSKLIYDCGKSLNPAVDIGQTEGAFVMGLGHLFSERVQLDADGRLHTAGAWEYKIPHARAIPLRLDVEFLQDSPFDKGVLSSKACGEPPLVLAVSVAMALRMAITSAREDAGHSDFVPLSVPITIDQIQLLCSPSDTVLEF